MLKGLEIVEKKLSYAQNNKDYRLDSGFYTSEIKQNENLTYRKIGDCLKKSQYGISINMNNEGQGYPIYRMNEIHNMFCDFEVDKFANISRLEAEIFKLNDGDVLFNRTNSYEWVGRTGIFRKTKKQDFVFASYLVRFIPDEKIILPEYLVTYLNSKYGIKDIRRRARQSINQTNVNPEEVKEMFIPLLSEGLQNIIKKSFDEAFDKNVSSQNLYIKAEDLLLEELGLRDFQPSEQGINIKSLKDSFLSTGRLDAEYYQPKYDDYLELIQNYSQGSKPLKKVCNLRDENFEPLSDEVYNYIELSNIGKSGDITGATEDIGSQLPSRARRIVNTDDVIISSIEGSLSSCALVTEDYDNALCSTGFYVINSREINSETLLVLFKSEPMQNILKQGCSGTILTAINKLEFQNIPVPLIEKETQNAIQSLIQQSFTLKAKSEQLLETAKTLVEMAIEQGEEKALTNFELGLA
nr:restriction endonuclease subunit S [Moraxella osloensis]